MTSALREGDSPKADNTVMIDCVIVKVTEAIVDVISVLLHTIRA